MPGTSHSAKSRWRRALLAALLAGLCLPACSKKEPEPVWVIQNGPPHGYRVWHPDGVDLVFDRTIMVYTVEGHEGVYHDGKRYFRRRDGHWQACPSIRGYWIDVSPEVVPPGLRAKYAGKHGHRRGHDHPHPAKIGY